jgi:hypothetical protein
VNLKNILIGLLLLTGIGCSSAPREVDASIALVPENKSTLVGEKIPAFIEKHLNQGVSQIINYNDYTIEILPTYISALGFDCSRLVFESKQADKVLKTACRNKNTDDWVFVKSMNKSEKQVVL